MYPSGSPQVYHFDDRDKHHPTSSTDWSSCPKCSGPGDRLEIIDGLHYCPCGFAEHRLADEVDRLYTQELEKLRSEASRYVDFTYTPPVHRGGNCWCGNEIGPERHRLSNTCCDEHRYLSDRYTAFRNNRLNSKNTEPIPPIREWVKLHGSGELRKNGQFKKKETGGGKH